MIRVLETIFRKTMRDYWYSGRQTGYIYGLNTVRTIIHAEIKHLSTRDDIYSRHRKSELQYLLTKIKDNF